MSKPKNIETETERTATSGTATVVPIVDPPWLKHVELTTSPEIGAERPSRSRLRAKRSYRCRVTFNLGLPGILLKSHINPLTGDSSMRAHSGKWFKKSSFARSFIPRLTVRSLRFQEAGEEKSGVAELSGDAWSVELKLTNPLDEDVMVSFLQAFKDDESYDLCQ